MDITIGRSNLSGSVQAPPSKSGTHRALFCAALADGESHIRSPLSCDDTLASAEALSKLGVTTHWNDDNARVIGPGELHGPSSEILCRESGTTLRFVTAVCATTPHSAEISGAQSLLKRPVADLAVALKKLGADCKSNDGYPPVHVKGPLQGGTAEIPGNVSSQYVSALLLVAPLAQTPVEIAVRDRLESKSYVKMTREMQDKFSVHVDANEDLREFRTETQTYRPCDVEIEGDWSSAAFLLAAGTLAGKVRVERLAQDTIQADRCLLDILKRMGASASSHLSSVTAEKALLKPVEVDVSDCPDLFPVICALCAMTDGVSTITGIRRLRIKESNRVLAMSNGLKQMGLETRESEDTLIVKGGKPHSAIIDSLGDHRIAMAFAVLGLCTDQVTIIGAESVGKSYPSFWQDLRSLGADVKTH
jgi:3-phosphoshikimate 1-carboxyvinyltransferase